MTSKDGTAEIFDMEDARRRRADGDEDIGELLQRAREDQCLTLTEAAAKTHIKEHHLKAIEALDASALPARPYAIGFVRAYAEFLDLDADDVVDVFKTNAGLDTPKAIDVEKFDVADKAAPARKPELSLLAVIAILAFVLWCAWQITLPREVRQLGTAPLEAAPIATVIRTPPAPIAETLVDARLIERVEPIYPLGCMTNAGPFETVTLSLSVTPQGRVAGERIIEATNSCFANAALIAVRRWKFEPMRIDGLPRSAHDQRFQLMFQRPL